MVLRRYNLCDRIIRADAGGNELTISVRETNTTGKPYLTGGASPVWTLRLAIVVGFLKRNPSYRPTTYRTDASAELSELAERGFVKNHFLEPDTTVEYSIGYSVPDEWVERIRAGSVKEIAINSLFVYVPGEYCPHLFTDEVVEIPGVVRFP